MNYSFLDLGLSPKSFFPLEKKKITNKKKLKIAIVSIVNKNIIDYKVLFTFWGDFPALIPKSFDPIFIKARKATKKPKTKNKYIEKIYLYRE